MSTLHSIGHVAQLLGIHPQTLREYERQGLVTPQRTPGGTRRYGRAELERLTRVQRLTAEGLSLAGVRYVLELEDRLQAALNRIAELEGHPAPDLHDERRPRDGAAAAQNTALVTRSMSVALVHVPRAPRSPRWRNRD